MDANDQIEKFASYFKRQSIMISGIRSDPEDKSEIGPEDYRIRFYQKVLIVTALDTLAGIRFPKQNYPTLHRKNQKRFIRFLSEYASWDCGRLVCLPFLFDDLKKHSPKSSKILGFIKDKLSQFDPKEGIIISPNEIDEPLEKILDLACTEKEEERICYYQHYALLYRYRNFLIHESREPGYAMDGIRDSENEAYYHGYINIPKWHLAYPVELFHRIFKNSIDELRSYLNDQQVDPYTFVDDTMRW